MRRSASGACVLLVGSALAAEPVPSGLREQVVVRAYYLCDRYQAFGDDWTFPVMYSECRRSWRRGLDTRNPRRVRRTALLWNGHRNSRA